MPQEPFRKRRIAFYAPLKPPDHPIASGDRQMARMLMSALGSAGHDAFLASHYISYSKRHGPEHLAARKAGALAEAARLLGDWRKAGNPPELWFCYHPYDKSPDWLGIEIAADLGIPMVNAEPCKTGQGPNGEWLPWRAEAQKSILAADMNVVMTNSDRNYLAGFVPAARVAFMMPFIDAKLLAPDDGAPAIWPGKAAACKLLSVGMMRPGAKMESYQALAAALQTMQHLDWSLMIAGGGPGEAQVRSLFSWDDRKRVVLLGERQQGEVLALMREADVLAWPGCREAYGMVYLEAAAMGTPAVALANMGVPLVVEHEKTGLLADPGIEGSYAAALSRLMVDAGLRKRLSAGARQFALDERSVDYAATILRGVIHGVFAKRDL